MFDDPSLTADAAHELERVSLGVPPGQTFLVPHDPRWATLFERERQRILLVLSSSARDVQHVGSTAIPGIRAKPIIDIVIAAPSYMMADDWQEAMSSLGYDYPGDIGIPEHRIYGRDRDKRRFLVHVVDADGAQWKRLVGFRDALLSDATLATDYEKLKMKAAAKHAIGPRGMYTDEKAGFIAQVMEHTFGGG